MMLALTNGRIFRGNEILTQQTILVQDDTILGYCQDNEIPTHYQRIDLGQNMLLPGLIDIQLYGGTRGFFVKDLSIDCLQNLVASHLKDGTTGLIPTLNSTTFDRILTAIDVTRQYIDSGQSGVLGLHIEGPYINVEKRGAHIAEVIRIPTDVELEAIIERCKGLLTIMTIAPEIWPASLLKRLHDSDIIVSVGHTNATYQQLIDYFRNSSKRPSLVTHLYNAMRPFESREPGVVGAVFDDPNVNASIIADGFHCDFATIRIAKKILGERLFVISDALGVNCEVERFELDAFNGNYLGDRFVNDEGKLAGSAITQLTGLKNLVQQVGINLPEAIRMVSTYPANHIGLGHQLGQLEAGYQANMILINDNFELKNVWVKGK
jgi:N-acetylglucosamine-6-phosphate deacetylase